MVAILSATTKHDRLRGAERPGGAPHGRLAGGWISDLAALQKAIVLCHSCARKWQPERYGYRAKRLLQWEQFVLGDCDGCGLFTQGTLFLSEAQDGSQRAA